MKRVLEMLMEMENLTPAERTSIQENIADIHSHTVGTIPQTGQQRYACLRLNIEDHP